MKVNDLPMTFHRRVYGAVTVMSEDDSYVGRKCFKIAPEWSLSPAHATWSS